MAQLSPPFLLPWGGTHVPQGSVRGIPWFLPGSGAAGAGFPPQFGGLRFFHGSVQELSLVALADAPASMGGVWKVMKGGTEYAVYLVETSDPQASAVRIKTSAGIKAARLKT